MSPPPPASLYLPSTFMAVVGSTISIDLHLTEDADLDSVRGATRKNQRVHPTVAERVRQTVQHQADQALEDGDVSGYTLSVNVEVEQDRVPGAPRERISASMDVEGEDSVVAAVDDAITPPDRARLADELEDEILAYLEEYDLAAVVDVIVSVTPIQFR